VPIVACEHGDQTEARQISMRVISVEGTGRTGGAAIHDGGCGGAGGGLIDRVLPVRVGRAKYEMEVMWTPLIDEEQPLNPLLHSPPN